MARLLAMTLDLRPNRRDQPKITLVEEPRSGAGSGEGAPGKARGKRARAESERGRKASDGREWASSQV
jgi:hypothetical protein